MKIVEIHDILNPDMFKKPELMRAWRDIQDSIAAVDWPHGSGKFTIYPESGKKRGEGNGVDPIKVPCIRTLHAKGWLTEALPELGASVLRPGDLDALLRIDNGYIAFEWETGNISSSHRAINKLLLTMREVNVLGSFLVVPSDKLKVFLTDRIGNIGELLPYFPLWGDLPNISGGLRIVVVEHDETSVDVPKIPKRTAGRALG